MFSCNHTINTKYNAATKKNKIQNRHKFKGNQCKAVTDMKLIFLTRDLRAFQDFFSSYGTGQCGRKRENPEKKTTGTPASRTWLVSHVASAGLEPTSVTAVRRDSALNRSTTGVAWYEVERVHEVKRSAG